MKRTSKISRKVRSEKEEPKGRRAGAQDPAMKKRETEKALRETEERYRVLVEASSEAMFLRNSEGIVVYANPAALNLVGVNKPEDLLGRNYLELVHPDDRAESIRRINRGLKEGRIAPRREHRIVTRNGEVIEVESTGLPLLYKGQLHLLGVHRDITERKKVEAALRTSEQEAKKSTRELEVILRIGQIISSSLDINEVYEPFAEEVRKLLDFDRIAINIVDLREGSFVFQFVGGADVPGRRKGEKIPLEGSFHAEVVRSKCTQLVQGNSWERALVDFPRLLPLYEIGMRSVLMVPLISKDQVIGVLALMSSKPEAYSDWDLKIAERVCLQIAGAVANAQLYIEWKKTEEELRISETRYRTLVEAASQAKEGVIMVQDEGAREAVIIFANEAAIRITGYAPIELQGLSWFDIISPRDLQTVKDRYRKRLRGEAVRDLQEIAIVRKDGSEIPIEISASPTEFRMRAATVGYFRDISDRKTAEAALVLSERRLRQVMDLVPHNIFAKDFEGRFIQVNRATAETYGLTVEELIGKTEAELGQPEDTVRRWRDDDLEVIRSGNPKRIPEEHVMDALGRIRSVSTAKIPFTFAGSRSPSVLGISVDITDLKRMEETLRESEARYRQIFEGAAEGIFQTTVDGRFLSVNPALARMFGYSSPQEMIDSVKDIGFQVYGSQEQRKKIGRMLAGRDKLEGVEVEVYRKDRSKIWISLNIHTVRDNTGNIRYFEGTNIDITERKKAEMELRRSHEELTAAYQQLVAYEKEIHHKYLELEKSQKALKESEEKYRILTENATDIIWSLNMEMKFTYVSPSVEKLQGWSVEELKSLSLRDILTPESLEKANKAIGEGLSLQDSNEQDLTRTIEVEQYCKDGSTIHMEIKAGPLRDPEGEIVGIMGVSRDITARKRAESALKESEERYRRLVENAPLGIVSVDQDGRIRDVNARLVSILDSPSAETILAVNLFTFSPLKEAGISANFRTCLKSGEAGVFETQYCSTQGKECYLRYHLNPIRDSEQKIAGVQAVVEDISERKRLEGQLLQAQKMEAIGTLAGGIAHDFNNILMAIMGYAELAGFELPENSKAKYNLDQSVKASHRAKDLVRQILDFSRQGKQERKPLDIGPIIREGLELLRASLPSTIEIRQDMEKDSGAILADPTQIHQILMNLCTNAGHAMSANGGVLEISVGNVDMDSGLSAASVGIEPGPYVRLRVSDTGQGMAPEIVKRIFDPYFTTKEAGKGTGLGLAMVQGVVKSYGGGITVMSEVGKGSTFEIYFPRLEAVPGPMAAEKVETFPLGEQERVLLVDDEQTLVEVGQSILKYLGYRVVARMSSVEALELFRRQSDQFDLVITDMTMPNMTGERLVQELLKIRPGIPIILCTGFSEQITEEKAKAMGVREFVMKPLIMKDLARAVRRALDWQKEKRVEKDENSDPS